MGFDSPSERRTEAPGTPAKCTRSGHRTHYSDNVADVFSFDEPRFGIGSESSGRSKSSGSSRNGRFRAPGCLVGRCRQIRNVRAHALGVSSPNVRWHRGWNSAPRPKDERISRTSRLFAVAGHRPSTSRTRSVAARRAPRINSRPSQGDPTPQRTPASERAPSQRAHHELLAPRHRAGREGGAATDALISRCSRATARARRPCVATEAVNGTRATDRRRASSRPFATSPSAATDGAPFDSPAAAPAPGRAAEPRGPWRSRARANRRPER